MAVHGGLSEYARFAGIEQLVSQGIPRRPDTLPSTEEQVRFGIESIGKEGSLVRNGARSRRIATFLSAANPECRRSELSIAWPLPPRAPLHKSRAVRFHAAQHGRARDRGAQLRFGALILGFQSYRFANRRLTPLSRHKQNKTNKARTACATILSAVNAPGRGPAAMRAGHCSPMVMSIY